VLGNLLKHGASSITTLFMFLLLVIAARQLGAEDFGRFSFAMALVFLFDPLLDPGLYHYSIRELARNGRLTERVLAHVLTWKGLAALPMLLIVGIAALLVDPSGRSLWAVLLLGLAALIKSCKDAFRSVLLSQERFGLDAISLFIERGALLAIGAYVLLSGHGLLALCTVFVVVRLMDLGIIAAIVARRRVAIRVGMDFSFLGQMLRAALPIAALYVALNFYGYISTVMLAFIRSEVEVGWYGASYRIYEGLLIIPGIMAMAFMPRLSRLYLERDGRLGPLLDQGLKYTFVIAAAVAGNGIIVSNVLVPWLFGNEFRNASSSLTVLLIGVPLIFCLNFLQTSMIAMDRQKAVLNATLAGLLANVVLNALLIPALGHNGAALSTVLCEALVLVIVLVYLGRHAGLRSWQVLLRPALAMSLAAAVPALMGHAVPLFVQVVLFNVALILMLLWLGCVDRTELSALMDFIRRAGPSKDNGIDAAVGADVVRKAGDDQ
jgi:O-antigen/teichoic acid export membrane protein